MSSSWLSLRISQLYFSRLSWADVAREMEKVKFENIIYSGSFLLKFIV